MTIAGSASATAAERRRQVEQRLRAIDKPRLGLVAVPPQGRLGADEHSGEALIEALAALGPVFAEFGRYLSSRIDLLPRRLCLQLESLGDEAADVRAWKPRAAPDIFAGTAQSDRPSRRFFAFDPEPQVVKRWTREHLARLAPGMPVQVTVVRPDALRLLEADLPVLARLEPWLGLPQEALSAAIDDFSSTLRRRLDQRLQCESLLALAEDAREGEGLEAAVCYPDFCDEGILTTERVDGVSPLHAADRRRVADHLAGAWLRQTLWGRVVPFDFDLDDIRLLEDRLIQKGGVFESQTVTEQEPLLRYLIAGAADDPDAAWSWIAGAASRGAHGQPEEELQRRLRQAVPFRDGESKGDDRLAERLLVQWRIVREAGWTVRPFHLRLFRGLRAIAAATTILSPDHDAMLTALRAERARRRLLDVPRRIDPLMLPVAIETLMRDLIDAPQKLDDALTVAAGGRFRVKLHVRDEEEGRRVRNRNTALASMLVALVGIALLVRQLAPSYGPGVEQAGAVLLLIFGGWLIASASRL